ncbi:MAG TPA: hypothetical protein ENI73_00995 [Spirochaetes bacterium]|mgnify:CR=1 FL=1|nr:hypothetical protein [Spirochaetota bacterium]
MRNIFILFKREFKAYFFSPVAYIISFLFLALSGYFFAGFVNRFASAEVGYAFGSFPILILFFAPFLTIRLISEEKRSGTLELMLTSPISPLELVIGKYLAAFTVFLTVMILPTLVYILVMGSFAQPGSPGLDYGVVFTVYMGLILFGASLLSIGIFTSSLTESQLIAGIVGFVVSLILYLIDGQAATVRSPFWADLMKELSLQTHYIDFAGGMIKASNVIFYLLLTSLFLLFANKSVESHVWK